MPSQDICRDVYNINSLLVSFYHITSANNFLSLTDRVPFHDLLVDCTELSCIGEIGFASFSFLIMSIFTDIGTSTKG